MKKFIVIGNARHGKDAAAELLADELGLRMISSSAFACENLIFPNLKRQYGYLTADECFLDRINHRVEWFNLISSFNTPDPAKLARDILATSDIYVGMRCASELHACLRANLADLVIWVDASQRVAQEGSGGCTVEQTMAHVVVNNNGSFEELREEVRRLAREIRDDKVDKMTNRVLTKKDREAYQRN